MSKKITFKLIDTSLNKEIGEVTFTGDSVSFKLDKAIERAQWDKIGFIPLPEGRRTATGKSISYFLNSRLPLKLRNASSELKISYIEKFGLKVASDSFTLMPA